MEKKKITGKTGLKKNIIKEDFFKQEISICRKLSKENNGKCNWGNCEKCGVLPLLYKLHKGILLEDNKEITELKNKFLD